MTIYNLGRWKSDNRNRYHILEAGGMPLCGWQPKETDTNRPSDGTQTMTRSDLNQEYYKTMVCQICQTKLSQPSANKEK